MFRPFCKQISQTALMSSLMILKINLSIKMSFTFEFISPGPFFSKSICVVFFNKKISSTFLIYKCLLLFFVESASESESLDSSSLVRQYNQKPLLKNIEKIEQPYVNLNTNTKKKLGFEIQRLRCTRTIEQWTVLITENSPILPTENRSKQS